MSTATATAGPPFDPDTFLVCGVPHLIATRAQVRADGTVPASALGTMRADAPAPGDPVAFVPVFTDADLAERFLAQCDPSGAVFVAFRPDSAGAFVVLLAELTKRCAWVGFDPRLEPGRRVLYPTAAVLRAVVAAAD